MYKLPLSCLFRNYFTGWLSNLNTNQNDLEALFRALTESLPEGF